MEKYLKVLSSSPLFAEMNGEDIISMTKCLSAHIKAFVKDEYIVSAGDRTTLVGVVLTGSVTVIKEDYWGNRSILSREMPGDLFGEAFACAGAEIIPVSAVAGENSEVMFVDCRRILTLCSAACRFHSQLVSNMVQILASKTIMLTEKLEHMSKRTTREKLLSFLSMQSRFAGGESFEIPFSRQELADYLSVDRSAMSWELCKLRDQGVLSFNKNHFKLL